MSQTVVYTLGMKKKLPFVFSATSTSFYVRLAFLTCTLIPLVSAEPAAVWAVGDGERILRKNLDHHLKNKNHIWDGEQIVLHAAKNEVIAFQLVIEAGTTPINNLRLKLDTLTAQSGQKIIYKSPSKDPTDYVDRPIQLFSLNYVTVDSISDANWSYIGAASKENTYIGDIPVQIVPENALHKRGGFPLDVPEKSNQIFWIEIYIDRDQSTGLFKGVLDLSADGWSQQIPMSIQVFNFSLPDENSMQAIMCYDQGQVKLYHGENLNAQYHRFAHRNRVEFTHAYTIETLQANKGRFTGDDFKRSNLYAGPSEGIGNTCIPRTFYGTRGLFDKQEIAWKNADAWMEYLNTHHPQASTFVYLPDEPQPKQYPSIHNVSNNIRSSPGPGKKLPTLVTHGYDSGLEGAIDIWCMPTQVHHIKNAHAIRSRGQSVWVYNGTRPHTGLMVYETPATDARAIIWSCFKHEIPVYFYWMVNHWEHNFQKPIDRLQNVWINPITFDNRQQKNKKDLGFLNGDGVLVYPGQDIQFPDQDRGIEGPCSSIRLANFRRGLQDHLYLTMARKIDPAQVDAYVQEIVPRVFGEAKDNEHIGFSIHGDDYDRVRLKLAQIIEAAQ